MILNGFKNKAKMEWKQSKVREHFHGVSGQKPSMNTAAQTNLAKTYQSCPLYLQWGWLEKSAGAVETGDWSGNLQDRDASTS